MQMMLHAASIFTLKSYM